MPSMSENSNKKGFFNLFYLLKKMQKSENFGCYLHVGQSQQQQQQSSSKAKPCVCFPSLFEVARQPLPGVEPVHAPGHPGGDGDAQVGQVAVVLVEVPAMHGTGSVTRQTHFPTLENNFSTCIAK